MRLTDKEAALVRSALGEYVKSVSEKARRVCGGYSSEEAIALCCLRLDLENLLADLDSGRRMLTVAPGRGQVTAAAPTAPACGQRVVGDTHLAADGGNAADETHRYRATQRIAAG